MVLIFQQVYAFGKSLPLHAIPQLCIQIKDESLSSINNVDGIFTLTFFYKLFISVDLYFCCEQSAVYIIHSFNDFLFDVYFLKWFNFEPLIASHIVYCTKYTLKKPKTTTITKNIVLLVTAGLHGFSLF